MPKPGKGVRRSRLQAAKGYRDFRRLCAKGVVYLDCETQEYGNYRNLGTDGGSATPSCGSCMSFDGSNDEITVGNIGNIKTLCLWVNIDTATEQVIDMNGTESITVSSNTVTLAGTWTGSTIYVDGQESTALSDGAWHHLAVTVTTAVNASAAKLGEIGVNNGAGDMAELALYSELAPTADIAFAYKNRKLPHQNPGSSLTFGNLSGLWPLSESFIDAGFTTAHDHSGNGNNGAVNGATPVTGNASIPQLCAIGFNQNTALAAPDTVIMAATPDGYLTDALGNAIEQSEGINLAGSVSGGSVSISAAHNVFADGGSLCAWFKPNSIGQTAGRIADKDGGGGASNYGWITYLNDESAGTAKLNLLHRFGTSNGIWITAARDIVLNEWNFVGVTYDRDVNANNPTFYIVNATNGFLTRTVGSGITETSAPNGARNSDAGQSLVIGNNAAEDRAFDGSISEVCAFDTTKTAAFIKSLWMNSKDTYT